MPEAWRKLAGAEANDVSETTGRRYERPSPGRGTGVAHDSPAPAGAPTLLVTFPVVSFDSTG
jgi:hypothetical protein